MSIIVNNISKQFGNQWAVKNVSIRVNSGEIVGFIGPNGAGKSTTMKILTGVLTPASGEVLINGMDIRKDPMKIKRMIGYLPEHNPLYEDMFVKEYLVHVANLYGIRGTIARTKVDETIEMIGLTKEQHKKIGKLSKGYKQRVGISQALIHDPEVLILDEPTSGLDPNQIIEIRNLISRVGKEKTVLLSTHIMQEVEAICDRVIIIDRGVIRVDEKAGNIGKVKTGEQTVIVELENEISPEKWKSLDIISGVRKLNNNTYLLASNDAADIRSKIFRFAVDNDLTVLSMTHKSKSLEEIFREYTGNEDVN
ncbi:MAG: gliding motility-associated ABC transporter ATP-binding subunit GldA [Bacteroidales bacterium]|nr:gliding motility-associated ABC transporter ATP-binding subunit GldA [Bacteroidales bacterium]